MEKVLIITKESNSEIRAVKEIMPEQYRDVIFAQKDTLLGPEIAINRNRNLGPNGRLIKAKKPGVYQKGGIARPANKYRGKNRTTERLNLQHYEIWVNRL